MKNRFKMLHNFFKSNSKKSNALIIIVALIEVIAIMLVSTSAWVETISNIRISGNGFIGNFVYTNADVSKDYNQPIDLSKYFQEGGDIHLASASSADGVNIYFPQVASVGSAGRFRHGGISDKNVNYISYSFKVKAVDADTSFVFANDPVIKIGGKVINDNTVRMSVSSKGTTKIFSKVAESNNVIGNTDGIPIPTNVNAFKDFTGEDDSKFVFEVAKGTTEEVTISLWLQDVENVSQFEGKTVTIDNLELCRNNTTLIKFVDRTTSHNSTSTLDHKGWHWIENDGAQMWVYDAKTGVSQKMTKSDIDDATWTVRVKNELFTSTGNFVFYRCAPEVASSPNTSGNYWNTWTTKLSEATSAQSQTYTAYGGTEGKGTWGEMLHIQLDTKCDELAKPNESDPSSYTAVSITDSANNEISDMNYHDGYWQAFIPNTGNVQSVRFTIYKADKTVNFSINATGRSPIQSVSRYILTSKTTGYWENIVTVDVNANKAEAGSVAIVTDVEQSAEVKVPAGTVVTLKAEPTSDRYRFMGWYTTNDFTTEPVFTDLEYEITVTESVTYYARFEKQYRVKAVVSSNDGITSDAGGTVQINDANPGRTVITYVLEGESATFKTVPKDSHNFAGWFDNEGLTGNPVQGSDALEFTVENVTNDILYFAKFDIKTFTIEAHALTNDEESTTGGSVKFGADVESSAVVTTVVKYNHTVVFKAIVNEEDGYEFKGWYKDKDCTELESEDAIYTISIKEEKVLYAKFKLKEYTVNVYAVSGKAVEDSTFGSIKQIIDTEEQEATTKIVCKDIVHGSVLSFSAVASADGEFTGWYSTSTNDSKNAIGEDYLNNLLNIKIDGTTLDIYAIFKGAPRELTLYVATAGNLNSSINVGTVKIESGSAGATAKEQFEHGSDIEITATPTSDYNFVGWYDTENIGKDADAISTSPTYVYKNINKDTVLYAKFRRVDVYGDEDENIGSDKDSADDGWLDW